MTLHKDMTLHNVFLDQTEEYFDHAIVYLKTINWFKGDDESLLNAIASAEKSKELAIAAIRSVKDIENVNQSAFQFRFSIMRRGF